MVWRHCNSYNVLTLARHQHAPAIPVGWNEKLQGFKASRCGKVESKKSSKGFDMMDSWTHEMTQGICRVCFRRGDVVKWTSPTSLRSARQRSWYAEMLMQTVFSRSHALIWSRRFMIGSCAYFVAPVRLKEQIVIDYRWRWALAHYVCSITRACKISDRNSRDFDSWIESTFK